MSPVYRVQAVPVEKVEANSYNPNVVAPPEMKLLELSIWEDGFTMPCVCYYDASRDVYILVDGFHRYQVLKTSKRIYDREKGLLPVVVIDKDLSNRMASTIRHNRARGTHNIELMCQIVAELDRAGMSDEWTATKCCASSRFPAWPTSLPTRTSRSPIPGKSARRRPVRNSMISTKTDAYLPHSLLKSQYSQVRVCSVWLKGTFGSNISCSSV